MLLSSRRAVEEGINSSSAYATSPRSPSSKFGSSQAFPIYLCLLFDQSSHRAKRLLIGACRYLFTRFWTITHHLFSFLYHIHFGSLLVLVSIFFSISGQEIQLSEFIKTQLCHLTNSVTMEKEYQFRIKRLSATI